jgi:hypothetical protein
MNLKSLSEQELISLRDRLQNLHTGCIDKVFIVTDEAKPHISISVSVKDKRLEDLLFILLCETHNELCDRFYTKINTEGLKE